jgi:hypothetical protein
MKTKPDVGTKKPFGGKGKNSDQKTVAKVVASLKPKVKKK